MTAQDEDDTTPHAQRHHLRDEHGDENVDPNTTLTGLRRRNVAGDNSTRARNNNNASDTNAIASRNPPRSKGLMDLLFSPLTLILGEAEPEDPQVAARLFTQSMQRRYGVHTPRFEMTSFRDAVSTARTMSKFLLVFLHSNIHHEAIQFAKKTICTEEFTTYVNESASVVAWAGCVQQMEGFGVSLSLGCASFPFVALLTCVSRGVNVVEKITANVSTTQLIRALETAVGRNSQQLMAARQAQAQRTEAQLLRQQQDLEYQQSLEADRRREEEASRAEEMALRQRRQEEEEARKREDEAKQKELEIQQVIERKRAHLAAAGIPPSRLPPPGAGYKTAMLKFHLHNGTRLERLFYAHDTLETVRDFVDIELYDRQIKILNYELATNFPKKVYGPDLLHVTLQDAGLAPQSLVYVQDLDS